MKTKPKKATQTKVVPLRLVPPPAERVSMPTIKVLEKLLHMAKCGELEGVIFAAMKKEDCNHYGWEGKAGCAPLAALGALEILKDELLGNAKKRGY